MTDEVHYLEQWRRKSDGKMVFIANVTEFTDVTFVHWRRPASPGQRTPTGRLELSSFLKRYEFREPSPEVRPPLEFPPDPQSQHHLDLILMMLKAERDYWGHKSNVWRIVAGDAARADACIRRAAELKAQYREFEEKWGAPGAIPVHLFEPEMGGSYTHEEGFPYESWRVREKSPGWEYRITGTEAKVVEADGGGRYGLLLAAYCSVCDKRGGETIGGPSQWSLANALSFTHRHWLEKHVFDMRGLEGV